MKKSFIQYFSLICFLLLPALVMSQGGRVVLRGVITSSFDKLPMPSAYVVLLNKDERVINHTVTDLDGNYSMLINPQPGDKLQVTYAGYKRSITPIKSTQLTVNIELQENVQELEGAVVTANKRVTSGMMNIAERDLTTSSVRIGIEELEGVVGASIDDALQGRIAGVDITAATGSPGAGMSIRIRGTSSINGSSQPLIVVDGFPFETEISSDFDFANADEEQYSQLLSISPDDIKEITVLKDAAATAIWGSRAANGVLQITTKRGAKSKPRITYTVKGSVSVCPTAIPTLSGDQYSSLIMDQLANAGIQFNPNNYPEFSYDVNQPYYFYNYGQNTNWMDEVTRNGFIQDHNLSISGGGDKAQYRASFGYYDQTGTTIGTDLQRLNTRLNIDYNISDKIKFQASMSYTHNENNRNYFSYLSSRQDVQDMAYTKMPNMSAWEYDAAGNLTGNYFSPLTTPQGFWSATNSRGGAYNPLAMANEGFYRITSARIIPNLSLIYIPISSLRYQLDVGFDIMNDKNKAFLPQTATGRPWNETSVNRADDIDSEAFIMQTFNKLIWSPNLGESHSFQGIIGLTTYDKQSNSYKVTTGNSASPFLRDPSVPARITNSNQLGIHSGASQNRLVSLFGNVQYGLLDRYIFNVSMRRDGSSRFGKNYRWGTFPAVSGRWRMSGEPFMKSLKWVDDFSFRMSYGVNGNQSRYDFGHISNYEIFDFTYLGQAGIYPSNLELIDLRWEKSVQYNGAIDFAFFKNRLNGQFEVYKKRTNDLLFYGLNIPTSTGFSNVDMNVGTMDNQGWELSLNATPYRSKDWLVKIGFNISRNNNIIRSISDQYPRESGVTTANGSYIRTFELNKPLGAIYGYKYEGVYLNRDMTIARDQNGNKIYTYNDKGERVPVQMRFGYPSVNYEFQEGDAMYTDINNDGNIDYQDIVYLGNANPKFIGGIGPSVKWKGLTVSAFFNFRVGNKIVNQMAMNMENMHNFNNQSTAVLRRWRQPYASDGVAEQDGNSLPSAPNGLLPRALHGKGYNFLGSDRFVEDGSFLRFKSFTVNYQFDKKVIDKTFLADLKVWLTMQNPYVWSGYSGQDPEVSVGGSDPFRTGYDYARTPRAKDVTLGVTAIF